MIPPRLEYVMDVRTKNPLNASRGNSRVAAIIRTIEGKREHARGRREARQAMVSAHLSAADLVPCTVSLIRISAGKMDDEGAAASLKYYRDGIAEALGVDDGSRWIRFGYGHEKSKPKVHGVRVIITKRETRKAVP